MAVPLISLRKPNQQVVVAKVVAHKDAPEADSVTPAAHSSNSTTPKVIKAPETVMGNETKTRALRGFVSG